MFGKQLRLFFRFADGTPMCSSAWAYAMLGKKYHTYPATGTTIPRSLLRMLAGVCLVTISAFRAQQALFHALGALGCTVMSYYGLLCL